MGQRFQACAIGIIRRDNERVFIEIQPKYVDGLLGLDQYSHIMVSCWFHESDTPQKRGILRVHPRGNRENPLTGVFATRSPVRPNPIALYTCKILSIVGNRVHIDNTDALDETPVIDIKPYIPRLDYVSEVRTPKWIEE